MYRFDITNEGKIIEFNNNNLHIKFSKDAITDIKVGKFSDIEVLAWLLYELDCYFVGENFCISNYEMGVLLYNDHSDKCYCMNFNDIDTLMCRKTLILYAYDPDEDTREYIEYFER